MAPGKDLAEIHRRRYRAVANGRAHALKLANDQRLLEGVTEQLAVLQKINRQFLLSDRIGPPMLEM